MPTPLGRVFEEAYGARLAVEQFFEAGQAPPIAVLRVYLDKMRALEAVLRKTIPTIEQVIARHEATRERRR
ncbi:MAG: hypothetical protein ACREB9_08960 [Thermoplasmata archaeon]